MFSIVRSVCPVSLLTSAEDFPSSRSHVTVECRAKMREHVANPRLLRAPIKHLPELKRRHGSRDLVLTHAQKHAASCDTTRAQTLPPAQQRSKMFAAQVNEVLAKVLLWNLSCIVHAIEEFGVEA